MGGWSICRSTSNAALPNDLPLLGFGLTEKPSGSQRPLFLSTAAPQAVSALAEWGVQGGGPENPQRPKAVASRAWTGLLFLERPQARRVAWLGGSARLISSRAGELPKTPGLQRKIHPRGSQQVDEASSGLCPGRRCVGWGPSAARLRFSPALKKPAMWHAFRVLPRNGLAGHECPLSGL